MMFYKRTYNKKTPEKPKRKVSTEDLLEDLGDTVDKVRRNSLKVPNVFCTLAYLIFEISGQRLLKECGEIQSQLWRNSEGTQLASCRQY